MAKGKTLTKSIELKAEEIVNALPLVGWHAPYATFEFKDEEWEVSIAGGVQALILKRPDNTNFSIALKPIIENFLEEIDAVSATKRGSNDD